MPKTLVLDFDGVIVDSIDECFDRTVDAYRCVMGDLDLTEAFRSLFVKHRYLVGPPSDYFFLVEAMLSYLNTEPSTQNVKHLFDIQRHSGSKAKEDLAQKFLKAFFDSRRQVIKNDYKAWCSQHRVFSNIHPVLSQFNRLDTFVATMKDQESVIKLIQHFNLDIIENNILGDGYGRDKSRHINEILRRTNVIPSEITFVDDNLEHLNEVKPLGVRLAFASWGYTKIDHPSDLARMGVEILS